MKVLLVSHHFPPSYIGGVELIVLRSARWLQAHGIDVAVVSVETVQVRAPASVSAHHDNYEGIPVWRLHLDFDPSWSYGWWPDNSAVAEWMGHFLRELKPTLVHVHSGYLISASVVEAAKGCGLPVAVSLHDYWFICSQINLLHPDGRRCSGPEPAKCAWCLRTNRRPYRWLDQITLGQAGRLWQTVAGRAALRAHPGSRGEVEQQVNRRDYLLRQLRSANVLITQARLVKDLLVKLDVGAERITLNPYGLDLSQFKILTPRPRDVEQLTIGYLGNIHPIKGVHILVEAFRALKPQGRRLRLRLHGAADKSPEYGRRLRQAAGDDPRIEFAGRYDNREVAQILSEMDVLVVPSLWFEIGPLVTYEAFACGVPVVAANLPNMAYQVTPERDGLLYEADDPADLARQLQRLIDEPRLLDSLREGIGLVRTVDQEMTVLLDLYNRISQSAPTHGLSRSVSEDRHVD